MTFEWISIKDVSRDLLDEFDCGEDAFNDFIKEQAHFWMDNGYASTYVAVLANELESKNITKIFAYAAINATGLLYNDGSNKYLSCVEVRMFAVSKYLRGNEAVDSDGVRYSYKVFQTLMQELYHISTHVLGFCAVTLNANSNGVNLYKRFGFVETDKYILPEEEEKLSIEGCTPLIFSLMSENALGKLFA